MKRILLLAIFGISAMNCFAHQDRIIKLVDGRLEGLPKQYEPASLVVEKKELTIGNHKVTIPSCIWDRFGDIENDRLSFAASWYHLKREGGLPPYMSIRNTRFSLLIDLDTLRIIQPSWYPKISEEDLNLWKIESIPNQAAHTTPASRSATGLRVWL